MKDFRSLQQFAGAAACLLSTLTLIGCATSPRTDNTSIATPTETTPAQELDAKLADALNAIIESDTTPTQLSQSWQRILNLPAINRDSQIAILSLDTAMQQVISELPPLPSSPVTNNAKPNLTKAAKLYVQARDLILQGSTQEAANLLQQVIEIDSESAPAWRELGRARYGLSDLSGARAALLQSVALNQKDPITWETLSFVSLNRREADLAAYASWQIINLDPSASGMVTLARSILGEQLAQMGYYRAAAEALQAAVFDAETAILPSLRSNRLASFLSRRNRVLLTTGAIWLALNDLDAAYNAYAVAQTLNAQTAPGRAQLGLAAILAAHNNTKLAAWGVARATQQGLQADAKVINQLIQDLNPTDEDARAIIKGIDSLISTQASLQQTGTQRQQILTKLQDLRLAMLPPTDAAEQLIARISIDPESLTNIEALVNVLQSLEPADGITLLSSLPTQGSPALPQISSALAMTNAGSIYTSAASITLNDKNAKQQERFVAAHILRPTTPAAELLQQVQTLDYQSSPVFFRLAGVLALNAAETELFDSWFTTERPQQSQELAWAKGSLLIDRGNTKQGLALLKQAIDPNDTPAFIRLEYARALLTTGSLTSAAEQFQRLLNTEEADRAALAGLLQIAQSPTAPTLPLTANDLAQALVDRHESSYETRYIRSLVLSGEGNNLESNALLRSLAASPTAPASVHRQLATNERARGQSDQALERLQAIHNARPADADFARLYAELLAANQRTDQATSTYNQALEYTPGNSDLSRSAESFFAGPAQNQNRALALRQARLQSAIPTPENTVEYIATAIQSGSLTNISKALNRASLAGTPDPDTAQRASELIVWLTSRAAQSEVERSTLIQLAKGLIERWPSLNDQAVLATISASTTFANNESTQDTINRVNTLTQHHNDIRPTAFHIAAQAILSKAQQDAATTRNNAFQGQPSTDPTIQQAMSLYKLSFDELKSDDSTIQQTQIAINWLGTADQWGVFGEQGVAGATNALNNASLLRDALDSLGQAQAPTGVATDINAAAASLAQYLGSIANRTGNIDLAVSAWEAGLLFEPDNAELKNSIAFRLLELGTVNDSVITYAEQASAAEPDSPNITDTLAFARLRTGNIQQALALFQRALDLANEQADEADPTAAFIKRHYADTLWIDGQQDRAIKLWVDAETAAINFLNTIDQDPDRSLAIWDRQEFLNLINQCRLRLNAVAAGTPPQVTRPIDQPK